MTEVKWIKLATGLFDDPKIRLILAEENGPEKVLLWIRMLCIAGQYNGGGAVGFGRDLPHTAQSLSVVSGLPQQTVDEAISTFHNYGMVTIEPGAGIGEQWIMITNWEAHQSIDRLDAIRAKDRERKKEERARTADGQSDGRSDGHSMDSPRTGDGHEKEANGHIYREEELEGDSKEKEIKKKEKGADAPAERSVLQEFTELWDIYPSGRKEGKVKAFRAFEKARRSGTTFEEIREGLIRYVESIKRKGTEIKFVKMGQTWFTNKCWEDDYEEAPEPDASYGSSEEFMRAALARGREETT